MIDPEAIRDQGESILKYTWRLESECNQWRKQFNEFCQRESDFLALDAYNKWAKRGIPFAIGAFLMGAGVAELVRWLLQ